MELEETLVYRKEERLRQWQQVELQLLLGILGSSTTALGAQEASGTLGRNPHRALDFHIILGSDVLVAFCL